MSEQFRHEAPQETIYVPEPDPMRPGGFDIFDSSSRSEVLNPTTGALHPNSKPWTRQSTGKTITEEAEEQVGSTPAQLVFKEHQRVAKTGYSREDRILIQEIQAMQRESGTAPTLRRYGEGAKVILRLQQNSTEEAAQARASSGAGTSEPLFQKVMKQVRKIGGVALKRK
jgi:hypothetical protein